MSDAVGDGRFPSDFMTRAKKLNMDSSQECLVAS